MVLALSARTPQERIIKRVLGMEGDTVQVLPTSRRPGGGGNQVVRGLVCAAPADLSLLCCYCPLFADRAIATQGSADAWFAHPVRCAVAHEADMQRLCCCTKMSTSTGCSGEHGVLLESAMFNKSNLQTE